MQQQSFPPLPMSLPPLFPPPGDMLAQRGPVMAPSQPTMPQRPMSVSAPIDVFTPQLPQASNTMPTAATGSVPGSLQTASTLLDSFSAQNTTATPYPRQASASSTTFSNPTFNPNNTLTSPTTALPGMPPSTNSTLEPTNPFTNTATNTPPTGLTPPSSPSPYGAPSSATAALPTTPTAQQPSATEGSQAAPAVATPTPSAAPVPLKPRPMSEAETLNPGSDPLSQKIAALAHSVMQKNPSIRTALEHIDLNDVDQRINDAEGVAEDTKRVLQDKIPNFIYKNGVDLMEKNLIERTSDDIDPLVKLTCDWLKKPADPSTAPPPAPKPKPTIEPTRSSRSNTSPGTSRHNELDRPSRRPAHSSTQHANSILDDEPIGRTSSLQRTHSSFDDEGFEDDYAPPAKKTPSRRPASKPSFLDDEGYDSQDDFESPPTSTTAKLGDKLKQLRKEAASRLNPDN